MSASPAFRFYPADFMGSPDVQAMELHEVGSYVLLLCTAWQSERHGYLADDDERLRRWSRMNRKQWQESRAVLLAKFPIVEEGWRANPRMVLEAEKQARYSSSQAEKGRKGGRPSKPELSSGFAAAKPVLLDEKTELSPGFASVKPSVSVSVSKKDKSFTLRSESPKPVNSSPLPPAPLGRAIGGVN